MGKPGFPMPLRAGGARPTPPGAGAWVRGPPARIRAGGASARAAHPRGRRPPPGEGVGKPGFPRPLLEGCALSLKQVLRAKLRRQARILLQTPLLIAGHQVDIELIDADRRQFCQAAAVLLWRANDAEPVHHLIAHKGGVG